MYGGIYPGGLIGTLFEGLFQASFSAAHRELLLFVVSWATLIIIVRFSFIVYLYPIRDLLARIPVRQTAEAIRLRVALLFKRPEKESPETKVEAATRFEQLLDDFKEIQQEQIASNPEERITPSVKATPLKKS